MKHALYAAAAWLLSSLAIYGLVAFTTFKLDPSTWGSPARFTLGIAMLLLGLVAVAAWLAAGIVGKEVE